MSLYKLERAVDRLPGKARSPAHVEALRTAAGKRLSAEERSFLLDHYQKESALYAPKARKRLAELAGFEPSSPKNSDPPKFSIESRHFTKIAEQSALVYVPALQGFLAVDDESSSLHLIRRSALEKGGAVKSVALEIPGPKLDDLEGVAFDPDHSRVLLVTEGGRKVYEVSLALVNGEIELGAAKKLGKLEKLGSEKNRGYEGLCYLPASLAPDGRAHLLAVHEGAPKRLGIFDPKTLEPRGFLALPSPLASVLKDLSDVAIDPKTGHLALLSDEGNHIGFVALEHSKSSKPHQVRTKNKQGGFSLRPLSLLELPELDLKRARKDATRLQPEGVTFDAAGDLWVSAEGDRSMIRFLRKP